MAPTQNHALYIREIPENCHTFTVFDPPKTDNLMTPGIIPKPEVIEGIVGGDSLAIQPI